MDTVYKNILSTPSNETCLESTFRGTKLPVEILSVLQETEKYIQNSEAVGLYFN